jgi:hypothetical protein
MPEICPILALGIYWLCFSFDPGELHLFAGSRQYDRFRKTLAKFQSKDHVRLEFQRRGIQFEDIGTHSMRKGAATYASSGSTACPSSTSIHLRAGWTLGGVQDTYLRFEGAGDMFVGRTVSGLPCDSHEFSTLPPHFKESSPAIDACVQVCFPGLPANLNRVGEFALASLVYHSGFLRRTLQRTHPIFLTALFQDPVILTTLSPLVVCGSTIKESRIQPTGIPPHVSLLRQNEMLRAQLVEENRQLRAQLQDMRDGIVTDITLHMDRRELGTGGISYHGVRGIMQEMFQEFRDTQVHPAPERAPSPQETSDAPEETIVDRANSEGDAPRGNLYYWGGRHRRVPESFKFPDCPPLQLWQQWLCGNHELGYPPLRRLETHDLTRSMQKRMCDARKLMNRLTAQAARFDIEIPRRPTLAEANEIFQRCQSVILVPEVTEHRRQRRKGQIGWRRVHDILHELDRRGGS